MHVVASPIEGSTKSWTKSTQGTFYRHFTDISQGWSIDKGAGTERLCGAYLKPDRHRAQRAEGGRLSLLPRTLPALWAWHQECNKSRTSPILRLFLPQKINGALISFPGRLLQSVRYTRQVLMSQSSSGNTNFSFPVKNPSITPVNGM